MAVQFAVLENLCKLWQNILEHLEATRIPKPVIRKECASSDEISFPDSSEGSSLSIAASLCLTPPVRRRFVEGSAMFAKRKQKQKYFMKVDS